MVRVSINELEFSDGSKIGFDQNDIVVLVGPNNAGKSATLKETLKMLENKEYSGKVVKGIDIVKQGSVEDLISSLKPSSKIDNNNPSYPRLSGYKYDVFQSNAEQIWEHKENEISNLVKVFANSINNRAKIISC